MISIDKQQQHDKPIKTKKKKDNWDWFLKKFDDGTYQTNHIERRDRRERRSNK